VGKVQRLSGYSIIFWSADDVGRECGLESAFGRIRLGDFVVIFVVVVGGGGLWTGITVRIEGAWIPEPWSGYLSLCLFFFLLFTFLAFEFPAFEFFTV